MLGHSATGAEPLGGPAPLEAELGAYGLYGGVGAFVLSGQPVAFVRDLRLVAGAGAFALSGQSASLNRGYFISAEAGAFALSGQSVALVRDLRLDAAAGQFDVTGHSVGFDFSFPAGAGVFVLSAGTVRFVRGSRGPWQITGTGFRFALDDVVARAGDAQLTNTRITGVGFQLHLDDTTTRGGL